MAWRGGSRINADLRGALLIADGGIRHSGDITKALAAGASSVIESHPHDISITQEAPNYSISNLSEF